MRVPRLAIAALPLLPMACFGSTGDGKGNASFDAASDSPQFEASSDDSATDSGMIVDSPVDVKAEAIADVQTEELVDGPMLPVTMTVRTSAGPEAGVPVVFQDANGNVITTVVTGASGSASRVVPAGSQVTVVLGTALAPQLVTIAGVVPGDMLGALDVTSFSNPQISVDAVPPSPPAGTTNYAVYAGSCWTSFMTPPASFVLGAACQSGDQFPLLVLAQNAGYVPVGFAFQKVNAIAVDEAGVGHVSPGGAWSTTTSTQTVEANNVIAGLSTTLAFSELATGVPLGSAVPLPAPNDAGIQGNAFPVHVGFGDAMQSEANVLNTATMGTGAGFRAIATRSAAPTMSGTTTLDLATLLPNIDSAMLDSNTTPAQPSIAWNSASSLASADGALVWMGWSEVTEAGAIAASWTIYTAASTTSIKAPALPTSAAAWAPRSGASFSFPVVAVIEASFLSGNGPFRAQTSSFPAPSLDSTGLAIVPPLPADGTVLMTTYGPNPS